MEGLAKLIICWWFFLSCNLIIIEEGARENSHNEVEDSSDLDVDKSKLPLQLAIVGRPNVGKSTLLNAFLWVLKLVWQEIQLEPSLNFKEEQFIW